MGLLTWCRGALRGAGAKEPAPADAATSTEFAIREDQAVPVDQVFKAWTSGNLQQMVDALERPTHPLDRHFLLLSIVEAAYKRRQEPKMAQLCVRIGYLHLKEMSTLLPSLRGEMNGELPRIPTYQHLATLLAEEEDFDGAIRICEAALLLGLHDGTKGGFQARIKRIRKHQARPTPHDP